jgi:hypothetical protein
VRSRGTFGSILSSEYKILLGSQSLQLLCLLAARSGTGPADGEDQHGCSERVARSSFILFIRFASVVQL